MTLHDAITESRRTDTVVDLALAETGCLDMAALQAENSAGGHMAKKPLLDVPFASPAVEQEHVARSMAREVADMFNHYSSDRSIDQFIDQMASEHRTLQQVFTRLCLHWFKHNSENPFFDGRNEYTVEVSKKIRACLEKDLGSAWCHTPFI